MRVLLLSSVAVFALAGAAIAADLPSRNAPPPVYSAPVYSFTWTGFYVGAQVGYQWGTNDFTETSGGFVTGASVDHDGFVGGLYAGANYQWNSLVLGVEGDVEYSGAGSSTTALLGFTNLTGIKSDSQWQGSLRGRIGVAFDRALIYATGGLAFADLKNTYVSAAGVEAFTNTETGWTLGGGLEYAFLNNWTARAEYRYANFGKVTNTAVLNAPDTYRHEVDFHTIRLGVGYKW